MKQSYYDRYEKHLKDGAVEQLSEQFYTFETEGDTLVGKLISVEDVKFNKPDMENQSCKRYVLDCDLGRVSCLLGNATDDKLAGKVQPGDLLRIKYGGKKQIDGGRQVNLFEVDRWGHEDV